MEKPRARSTVLIICNWYTFSMRPPPASLTRVARSARLATLRVVADGERIGVEHHALEAGVRAHVLANLLAQEARVAVGGKSVKENPERFPATELPGHGADAKILDGAEIADEG